MVQSTGDECGICLDALTNPVALPCGHNFCSNCLDSWRPKHYAALQLSEGKKKNSCPLCREKIPPSREMIVQLRSKKEMKRKMEERGDTSSEAYISVAHEVEQLELEFEDWTEAIDYSGKDACIELPTSIHAAGVGATKPENVQKILDWLGPPPVEKRRIDAKDPDAMDATLIFFAVLFKHSDLLSILLQFGADVNALDAAGGTALHRMGFKADFFLQTRLLLEWGADIVPQRYKEDMSKDGAVEFLLQRGNSRLANLFQSDLGGRRCELVNFPTRPDLNGKTCVVEKYLPERDRYKIIFEGSQEKALVPPDNLKRRDRTPTDCGYYITFNKGKFSRREFASKEECQAYVAEVEAKGLAEQVAQLDVGSSNTKGKSGKKGRKKKGKKGRK